MFKDEKDTVRIPKKHWRIERGSELEMQERLVNDLECASIKGCREKGGAGSINLYQGLSLCYYVDVRNGLERKARANRIF